MPSRRIWRKTSGSLVGERAPAFGADEAGSVGRHKVAHAAPVVDDAPLSQVVVGFHGSVHVYLQEHAVLPDARDALVGGIRPGQYLVAEAVGYLHVDGLPFFERHGRHHLRVMTCMRQKRRHVSQ